MGYPSQEIDIPIYGLNQALPERSGPLGRVKTAINGRSRKFIPAAQTIGVNTPAQITLEPRDGIHSLPNTARSIVNGLPAAADWTNPEILGALGDQAVTVVNGIPYAWNGTNWTKFVGNTVVPYHLKQDVFHTSQHTLQAPDEATIGGVTCATWTETVVNSTGPITSAWVGFKSSDGAWLVAPSVLGTSGGTTNTVMAKVRSDGSHFWVVFNGPETPAPKLNIYIFDTNGAFLAGTTMTGYLVATGGWPGFWDIVNAPTSGGYTLQIATPALVGNGADSGAKFVSFGWNGSAIIQSATNTDATVHCSGPIAWITNDLGNGLAYLETVKSHDDFIGDVWAYEITNRAQTHEFGTGINVPGDSFAVDTLAGVTFTDGNGVGVVLSIGAAPTVGSSASHGPKFDPGLRLMESWQIERTGTTTQLRTTQSMAQVSRAFAIDGNYYTVGYYQSGSGSNLTPTSQTVGLTIGDKMIGAPVQPINIQPGDSVQGSPIPLSSASSNSVQKTLAVALGTLTSGTNTVTPVTITGMSSTFGIPDGTPALSWFFSTVPPNGGESGGRMTIANSPLSAANGTFDVIATFGGAFLTPQYDITKSLRQPSGSMTNGTTTTMKIDSMVGYGVTDLSSILNSTVVDNFIGGSAVVSGASHSGNNGTFTVARVFYGPSVARPQDGFTYGYLNQSRVWVAFTTQVNSSDSFSLTLSSMSPNTWTFADGEFSTADVGANLVIADDVTLTANNGTFPITSVPSPTQLVTGSPPTQIMPQVFAFPFPTASIQLTSQQPYTFTLQGITLDYTYQNAIVSIQGAQNAVNDGTYQITDITGAHTFIAARTDGSTDQVNETFETTPSPPTITIFFLQNIQPLFQPTWFLVPLTGTQPVAGRWEYGQAYADWRFEANQGTFATAWNWNTFPQSLSTPHVTADGIAVALPFRAQNVTQAVPLVTVVGQVPFAEEIIGNTVGLKTFTFSTALGLGFQDTNSYFIPGPMASVMTQSGVFESGINLAPEAPFLISQSVSGGATLGITLGATRIYQAVAEYTDENGDLIESIPSPPLTVNMSGTNNQATIGGRLMFPLSSTGGTVANTYGPTTRNVTISLYATAIQGGIATTQKHLITNDLNPNGLAPVSTLNPSGFSFPDSFTWNYLDSNPDVGLTDNQELYTDSERARHPAPAFSRGLGDFKNRDWVVGYDDAIWMSFEKVAGQAVAWNPALRWQFPADNPPKTIASLDDNLFVFCARTIYVIPLGGASLPQASGIGSLPTPVPLPWPVGSRNGHALGIPDLVVFDSTAGGAWAINRGLETAWLSHPVIDALTGTVTGMCLDSEQKLYIQQDGTDASKVIVYDHVPGVWGVVACPTPPRLIATYAGQFTYQDTGTVNVTVDGAVNDQIAGVTYGIAPDLTFQSLSFANVRGLKMIWGLQLVGQYLGAHRVNIVISYPDDGYPDQVIPPFTPDPTKPYIIPFYLDNEEVTTFELRVYADFVGVVTPGASFSLELIGAEIGVQPGRLAQLPDSQAAT
jgi:hypothetical protein